MRPVTPVLDSGGVHRSGYVAIVGRPNVGKSTLLNELLGQKLAATTAKPQTTRKNLLGIPHLDGAQLSFLDTPGHHQAKGPLNRFMVEEAEKAIGDADVVTLVVEAREDGAVTPGNERLLECVRRSAKPVVVAINKVDLIKEKERILLEMDSYQKELGAQLVAVVPISARKRRGLEPLVREVAMALPEGPAHFPADQLTDASERSLTSELIREKVMIATRDELPYVTAVTVEEFSDDRPKLVRIVAVVHVERDSQKGIILGQGGARIKAIGTKARLDIERLVGAPVYLDLIVRVTENWAQDDRGLAKVGYSREADA